MADFDVVIRGATVFDGSGSPGIEADIGISGDRIAAVGPNLSGAVLNARGLAAAPGFIDAHSHSELRFVETGLVESKLRQGICLEIMGQDGVSVAPVRAQDIDQRRQRLKPLLTDPPVDWRWRTVGNFLEAIQRRPPATDVAYLVPHGAIRECVMGMEARPPTGEELQRMRALLYQAFEQGALGLSTGLIYPPCSYCDASELTNLAVIASVKEAPLVVHLRSESSGVLEALDEVVGVAMRSKVRLHLSHLKIAGATNWAKVDRLIATLEKARQAGVHVSADQYPYTAGATAFSAILPDWVHASGSPLSVLLDSTQRARIKKAMLEAPPDRENLWLWGGPEGIVISDVSESSRDWVGQSIASASQKSGREPLDFALDLLAKEKLGGSIIIHGQSETVLEQLMALRFVSVCTDALLVERSHPRSYGAFPRVLARYVRERRTLTLEEAIRKMTGQTADAFGLREHGYISPGQRANIVLFDPEKIQDTATFEKPDSFPVGISHVFVGGRPVIRDGELTENRPGQIVRHPAI